MRKRTIKNIADKLYWLIVAMLPLVIYLIQLTAYELIEVSSVLPSFAEQLQEFGIIDTNIILVSLRDLFGSDGVLPLLEDNSVVMLYLAYFVMVEVVHLAIDFLVFIPRLSHKWMDSLTNVE